MKKLAIFLTAITMAINLHGQDIDQFIGKYTVTEIRSDVFGGKINSTDTMSYFINIVKYNDTLIGISFFAEIDTVKATVISDSIDIFLQTLYYDEWTFFVIHGSGRLYRDTLKYKYSNGGPIGSFRGDCVAVKVNGNSINNLPENNKSLINLYSTNNGLLKLQLKSYVSGEIILYTPDGNQVLKKPITSKENTFYAPVSGLLLYRFINEKGEIQTGKVLVR
jgi:hypothetical protein